jgi:hypothetical protein
LTSSTDPQRHIFWDCNDANAVNKWYHSAVAVGVERLIVFTDDCTPEFALQYPKALFVKVPPPDDGLSLNDYRFLLYLSFLKRTREVQKVLMTDLFDVEFFKNPFDAITQHDTLYIGSTVPLKEKLMQRMRLGQVLGFECVDKLLEKPLLIPGIVGGYAKVIERFLTELCKELCENAEFNVNMPCTNKVAWLGKYKVVTGAPLHTQFKKYETAESGCYVRHK